VQGCRGYKEPSQDLFNWIKTGAKNLLLSARAMHQALITNVYKTFSELERALILLLFLAVSVVVVLARKNPSIFALRPC